MSLDYKTLIIMNLIVTLVSAGAMTAIWKGYKKRFPSISSWAIYMICQALGSILLLFQGTIPAIISVVTANSILVWGGVLLLVGMEKFVGQKSRQTLNYILFGIYLFAFTYFELIQPNLMFRKITWSTAVAVFTLQITVLLLWRVPSELRKITRATGIIIGGYFLIGVMRLVSVVFFPVRTSIGLLEEVSVILFIILHMCLIISMTLMVTQRLFIEAKEQEVKFNKLFYSSPTAILLTRLCDGIILEVNNEFCRKSGYEQSEVIGKTTNDLKIWENTNERQAIIDEVVKNGKAKEREIKFRMKSGEILIGLVAVDTITVNNEKCMFSTISDVTEKSKIREKLNEEIREKNELLEKISASEREMRDLLTIIEYSPISVIITDTEGVITYGNREVVNLTGYTKEEIIGKNPRIFKSGYHSEEFYKKLWEEISSGKEWHGEFRNLKKNGEIYWERSIIIPVKDENDKVRSYLALKEDVTENKKHLEILKYHAERDTLTGIFNRRAGLDFLESAVTYAQKSMEKLVVCFIDINNLKHTNDNFGHDAGDEMIKTFVEVIISCLREEDVFFRLGGDEFMIVFKSSNIEIVERIWNRIKTGFDEINKSRKYKYILSASHGIIEYKEKIHKTVEELIGDADKVMYEEKKLYREK